MSKRKFSESPEAVEAVEGIENAGAVGIDGETVGAEATEKPQSEAGAKISAAQKGVPKQRIVVITQVGDAEPVEHPSLCAAVVAHGLSKEVDWYTGRNALKSSDSWETKGKVWSTPAEGEEAVVESEYDVTFKLVSASWKTDAAEAATEAATETAEAA